MDETETKISNDDIILKEELDININDLFTIDFKNLKIFLTTILQNQNKISQKMNFIETKINDKEKKIDKNFSLLDKKIKTIENNFSANSDKLENLQKGVEDKKNKEEVQDISIIAKNKEEPENIIVNSNFEILTPKRKEIPSNNTSNNIIIKQSKDNDKDRDKDKDEEKEKLKEDKKNKEKEKEKEEEKHDEVTMNKENENIFKNEIINKEIKSERNKKLNLSEKENKSIDNIISEVKESIIKSGEERDTLENNETNKNKKRRGTRRYTEKYEDPYKYSEIKKYQNNQLDEIFTKFPYLINELDNLKNKVDYMEKKMKATERGSRLIAVKGGDNDHSEELQYLKLQIKDLEKKNKELEKDKEEMKKELEDIKVKVQDFNIYDIFKGDNNDEGNADLSKALVMTLEQKVFKKTGLIDGKIKLLEESLNKLQTDQKNIKNIAEILKLSNDDIKRMIKNLEENENKNAEDYLNLSNDINSINNDIKKLKEFETKANETLKNYDTLLQKIQNNLTRNNNRLKEIDETLEDYEQNKNGIDKAYFHKFKNEITEVIKDLKRKNSDVEKEIEYLKKHPDLIKAREDINKLQKEIIVKVNKTDFLDLKDKFSMQNIDIINLNDAVDKIQESANKTKNDSSFFLKRLEALSGAQISTRTALNDLIKKQQEILFDTSKYLEISSFDRFLTGFQKEKESLDNNFISINKLLKEMAEVLKTKSGSEDMKLLEQVLSGKFEELKLYCVRKLADKIETNRNIKYLDSQIRHIIDVYIKKQEKSESWLIAKKPLGGFSCASCESYLGELKNTKEYSPWSKYPNREDKNFRYGNGFSRMLNMLNIDFKSQLDSIKDNAYESDNDGRNSAESKSIHNRRFSKNLSSANVYNTQMNSRNKFFINTNNINNNTNKNDIFPKIGSTKNENNNGNFSMEQIDNGNNTKINESNIYSENEKNKDNTNKRKDEPQIIKIYRKNKFKSVDTNKKIN